MEDFKAYIDILEMVSDWKSQPWYHVCYNRFSMQYLSLPDRFVYLIKRIELNSKDDLKLLIDMGANSPKALLGSDLNGRAEHEKNDKTGCLSTSVAGLPENSRSWQYY